MSFNFPDSIQEEIKKYALAEHISTDLAAVKLVQVGLKTVKRKASSHRQVPIDWDSFRQLVPGIELFQDLPDDTVDALAKSSHRIRTEKLMPRA